MALKSAKYILRILYYSQLLMAFSAAAFLFTCATLLHTPLPWPIYLAAVVGTLAIYVLDCERGARTGEDQISQPERSALYLRLGAASRWLAFVCLAFATGLLALNRSFTEIGKVVLPLTALSFAYVFAIIPNANRWSRLKDFPDLKSLWVASGWTWGGIGFCIQSEVGYLPLLTLATISWVLLLWDTLLLDYRDRKGDIKNGVRTWAQSPAFLSQLTPGLIVTILATLAVLNSGYPQFKPAAVVLLGMTAVLSLASIYLSRRPRVSEIQFGILVSLWRFAGAALAFYLYR